MVLFFYKMDYYKNGFFFKAIRNKRFILLYFELNKHCDFNSHHDLSTDSHVITVLGYVRPYIYFCFIV